MPYKDSVADYRSWMEKNDVAFNSQFMNVNHSLNKIQKFHEKMTLHVIVLHQNGYVADFFQPDDQLVICSQNNKVFKKEQLAIQLTGKYPVDFSNQYRYLHTVVSEDGTVGILVSNNNMGTDKEV